MKPRVFSFLELLLGGSFEQREDLLSLCGSRIDRADVFVTLHLPDRGDVAVFLTA